MPKKRKILICGGAGFIGSNLAVCLATRGDTVVCLDNLSRRGSERILPRILEHGCQFVHGDLRNPEDLAKAGACDVLIECCAEPSVLVGSQGADARYMVRNNLETALNAFEHARVHKAGILFLSTSRVYPYGTLGALPLVEHPTRFDLATSLPGVSPAGVSPDYPLAGVRSLYGATKLAAEHILTEYAANYDLPAIINRCGVVAGPWQLGKVDQGVFTYWLAAHHFGKPLKYIGYGGEGKQVRDVLHIDDLVQLVEAQIERLGEFRGAVFHAGGGRASNLSLAETTAVCQTLTGNAVPIEPLLKGRPADLPWYITDCAETTKTFGWTPLKDGRAVLADTHAWMCAHEAEFSAIFNA
jgi:CDP-paratose 2-epimerase